MGDREAEPSFSGVDHSYTQCSGADVKKIEVIKDEICKACGSSGKTAHMQETANTRSTDEADANELHVSHQEETNAGENNSRSPPSIKITEFEDIDPPKIAWNKAGPVDVLLIVVNNNEFRTVYETLSQPEVADSGGKLGNVYFGTIGRNKVALVKSGMGSGGMGGSQKICSEAIKMLHPKAVTGVGVCFGMNSKKQKLADVLVSGKLAMYALVRINDDGSVYPRGEMYGCDVRLVKLFSGVGWKCPSEDEYKSNVYSGLIISGPELVDNKQRKEKLKSWYPEALGGEMEAEGIYVASEKVPSIIIKSISDWGDGTKNETWQLYAAAVAASFVKHVLTENYIPESETGMATEENVSDKIDQLASRELETQNSGEISRGRAAGTIINALDSRELRLGVNQSSPSSLDMASHETQPLGQAEVNTAGAGRETPVPTPSDPQLSQLVAMVGSIAEKQLSLEDRLTKNEKQRNDKGNRPSGACFTCGGLGHFARDCHRRNARRKPPNNNRPLTCFSCGRVGHFVRDCRNQRHLNS